MLAERDDEMIRGLERETAAELRTGLTADEWSAFLQVHQHLTNAPSVAPTAGFDGRVLERIARQAQPRARRRALGVISLLCGALLLTALSLRLSPVSLLLQVSGWATFLNAAASFVTIAQVALQIARTFLQVSAQVVGAGYLLALALFALALTLIWTRVVAGLTLLNRPIRATEV